MISPDGHRVGHFTCIHSEMEPDERLAAQVEALAFEEEALANPRFFEAHNPCSRRRREIEAELRDNTVLEFGGQHPREGKRFPDIHPRVTATWPEEGFTRFQPALAEPMEVGGGADGGGGPGVACPLPHCNVNLPQIPVQAAVNSPARGVIKPELTADVVAAIKRVTREFVSGMGNSTVKSLNLAFASSVKTPKTQLQRETISEILIEHIASGNLGEFVPPRDEQETFEATKGVISAVADSFFAGLDRDTRALMGGVVAADQSLAGRLRAARADVSDIG